MAYLTERAAAQDLAMYQNNIAAIGVEHPDRNPIYCKLLTKVAATLTGGWPTDDRTGWKIVNLARQLDRPGRPSCVNRLIAATPPEAESIRQRMRLCQHHRAC